MSFITNIISFITNTTYLVTITICFITCLLALLLSYSDTSTCLDNDLTADFLNARYIIDVKFSSIPCEKIDGYESIKLGVWSGFKENSCFCTAKVNCLV